MNVDLFSQYIHTNADTHIVHIRLDAYNICRFMSTVLFTEIICSQGPEVLKMRILYNDLIFFCHRKKTHMVM